MTQQEIDQSPELWKTVRRDKVTASEIAAIMGLSPKTHESAFSLFVAKTSGTEMERDNDEMLRGRVLEPYVAEAFEASRPWLHVMPGGLWASEDRPWQAATLDRLAYDLSELGEQAMSPSLIMRSARESAQPVEIKTSIPGDDFGEPGTAQLPVHIRCQALWQMDTYDSNVVWVPVQFMMPWKLVVFAIERNAAVEHDIDLLRQEGAEFLERVRTDRPPPVDWRPATTRALKTLHKDVEERSVRVPVKLSRRFKAARLAKASAEQRLAQAQNELRDKMGTAKYAVTVDQGRTVKVVTRSKSQRPYFPADVIREKYPDVAKATEAHADVDALYPGSWAQ